MPPSAPSSAPQKPMAPQCSTPSDRARRPITRATRRPGGVSNYENETQFLASIKNTILLLNKIIGDINVLLLQAAKIRPSPNTLISKEIFCGGVGEQLHLETHGKPVAFYSDKHNIFRVN